MILYAFHRGSLFLMPSACWPVLVPILNPYHSHSRPICSQQHPGIFQPRRSFWFPAWASHHTSQHGPAMACRTGPLGSMNEDKLERFDLPGGMPQWVLKSTGDTAPRVRYESARLQAPCDTYPTVPPKNGLHCTHAMCIHVLWGLGAGVNFGQET